MTSYKEKKQRLKQLVKQEEEERKRNTIEFGHKFLDTDPFKRAEKHYKFYQHRQTDFTKILKLENLQFREVKGKKVYVIPQPKGAYLVKNFHTNAQQNQIGYQALNQYIYRPYRTNLDGTNGLYEKQQEAKFAMEENLEAKPIEVKDQNGKTLYYFNQKIRMTNLGYQYDWPKRSYPSTKVMTPQTITQMTSRAVDLFQEISGIKLDYKGEAVIVNYYKPRDYMTGHLDDGQIDQINPIFSFCFGLSCIFLIGSPSKETEPIAIELEAGDLMIMSGFSRICYHGVPRILENSFKIPLKEEVQKFELRVPANCKELTFANKTEQIQNYFSTHRLNINVRQVYPSKSDTEGKIQMLSNQVEQDSGQQKSEQRMEMRNI